MVALRRIEPRRIVRSRWVPVCVGLSLVGVACSFDAPPVPSDTTAPTPGATASLESSGTPRASGLQPLVPPSSVREDDLRLSCGSPLSFSAQALSGSPGAERADHPAAAAVRDLIASDQLPDRSGWQLVVLTDSNALFVLPASADAWFSHWSVELDLREGRWEFVRSGQCDIRPVFEGIGPAKWELAPDQSLQPDTQRLDVLVTELGCASGMPPDGRVVPAAAIYRERDIIVIFGVEPLPGAQTCQGAPPARVTLELEEPVGDRVLLDGYSLPPEPRAGPP